MSGRYSSASIKYNNYAIVPPSNFCYLEDTLCRCSAPISRNSISFLHSISIGCIINVSGKKLDGPLSSYCEEQGILVKTLFLDGEDTVLLSSIPRFNEWIAETLGVVIFQCGHTNTLVMGSTDTYYDCLLVACLRKFQQWSFVSILSEFRQQVWPHRLFDFEQLIDHFDRNLVDITSSTPDYLLTHNSLEKEEEKMKERLRVIDEQAGVDGAQLDPEQEKVDRLLNGLFFSGGNQLLSVGIEFDSQLSLINDKDEED